MFRLDVAVDVIPLLSGRKKYVAKCGSSDNRHRVNDFKVEGSNMRDVLTVLVNTLEELNIPTDNIYVAGEFSDKLLTNDDKDAWATTLDEIKAQDSGLNKFLKKI